MEEKAKVFISYAREDWETAKRLYDDLSRAGVRPFESFDPLGGLAPCTPKKANLALQGSSDNWCSPWTSP